MCGAVCSAELQTNRAYHESVPCLQEVSAHGMEGEEQFTPRKGEDEDVQSKSEDSASESKDTPTRLKTVSDSSTAEDETQTKRLRTEAQEIPSTSSVSTAAVAPSPPQFMSLAEVMKAADGLKNMVLAHEIALDSDFELQQPTAVPEGSLFARVQEMMHKAFWDLLASELAEDPPCYNQAMTLLREVKETLLEMVPPRAVSLRTDIEQKLDVDLIQQQAEAGTLDFQSYAQYVIHTMGRMCCPIRDDEVTALKEISEVVATFKGILEVLKKMKLDYANFAIREARPMIVANSIIYEKKKFGEFLATQQDGLEATREWLLRHKEKVLAEPEGSEPRTLTQLSTAILGNAYMEALEWPDDKTLPETLTLDHSRIKKLNARVQELNVLATVVLVTLPVVGQSVRDLAAFKEQLKEKIKLLLKDVDMEKGLPEVMPNIAAQVEVEIGQALQKLSLPPLSAQARAMLKGQVEAVAKPDNRIKQLAKDRLVAFLTEVISSSSKQTLKVPVGFSAFKSELSQLAGDFNNLVWYNRSVFAEWYATTLDLRNLPQARAST